MIDDRPNPDHWTSGRKICFRFFFAYFIIQLLLTPKFSAFAFGVNVPLFEWFKHIYDPILTRLNENIFKLNQNESNLGVLDFIFEIMVLVVSAVTSAAWSLIDKKRNAYNKLNYWLRFSLRIALSAIMFGYGLEKLLVTQMPIPDPYSLETPIGSFDSMQLLWASMSASKLYQSFTGVVELVGAVCILFNRTFVLGLLMLTGTLTNVLMLNIGYNIGVLYYVIFLIVITVYLLWPYLGTLINYFIRQNTSTLATPLSTDRRNGNRPIYFLVTFIIIASFYFQAIWVIDKYNERSIGMTSTRMYKIKTHTVNGDTLLTQDGNEKRWRYWVEHDPEHLSIYPMKRFEMYSYTLRWDTIGNVVFLKQLSAQGDSLRYQFAFQKSSEVNTLLLKDNLNGVTLEMELFDVNQLPMLKNADKLFPFDF